LGERVERDLRAEGAERVRLRAEIDARYVGQAFEVTVPHTRAWERAFHKRHAERYGFALKGRPIEAVRLRVRGEGVERASGRRRRAASEPQRVRAVRGARHERSDLEAGCRVRGPARIEERSGTTWVARGWVADVLADGTLRMRKGTR
jgi:N-methylhydantoinase A